MDFKIEQIFDTAESNFDKKRKINAKDAVVPDELIDKIIKEGITSEFLEEYKFPIFKYRTQITLHGKYNINKCRSGGYKNLIRNKNGSLGVKYSAIDIEKKLFIKKVLKLEKSRFNLFLNSTECSVMAYLNYSEANVATMKEVYNLITNKNYIGYKQLYVARGMYGTYVVINIRLNAIFKDRVWLFISELLGREYTEADYIESKKRKQIEDERFFKEVDERYKKEKEKREKEFNEFTKAFFSANKIKHVTEFREGIFLFIEKTYVYSLHIFKKRGRLMFYTEICDYKDNILKIPETDIDNYNRRLVSKHHKERLYKNFAEKKYFIIDN